jgi:hypothetical protein
MRHGFSECFLGLAMLLLRMFMQDGIGHVSPQYSEVLKNQWRTAYIGSASP